MEEISTIIYIFLGISSFLAIIAILSSIKKAKKNESYQQFFEDRNLSLEDLEDSNKKIFLKKETGTCKNCGRKDIEIFSDTKLCHDCSYSKIGITEEFLNSDLNILDISNAEEEEYELNELSEEDFNNIPSNCVFLLKNENREVIDIYQTNKFRKEIKKIINLISTSNSKEFNELKDKKVYLSIIKYNFTEEDYNNIVKLLKENKYKLYFTRQLLQLQLAKKYNPKYWSPSAGDQQTIVNKK